MEPNLDIQGQPRPRGAWSGHAGPSGDSAEPNTWMWYRPWATLMSCVAKSLSTTVQKNAMGSLMKHFCEPVKKKATAKAMPLHTYLMPETWFSTASEKTVPPTVTYTLLLRQLHSQEGLSSKDLSVLTQLSLLKLKKFQPKAEGCRPRIALSSAICLRCIFRPEWIYSNNHHLNHASIEDECVVANKKNQLPLTQGHKNWVHLNPKSHKFG